VAPKVAGSRLVGHPSVCRKNARHGQTAEPRLLQSYTNPSTQSLVSIASASLSPIGAFLGPPHAGNPVESESFRSSAGAREALSAPLPSALGLAGSVAGLDRPGGAFALLHAEASRGRDTGPLVGHHRCAVVSVERLDEASRSAVVVNASTSKLRLTPTFQWRILPVL
jgi:hypothetical protein